MKTIIIGRLEWQEEDNGILRSWEEAMEYAASLGNRWRLPTIKELISIVDFNTCNPACKIKDCISSYYWSSSSDHNDLDDNAWFVHFNRGRVDISYKINLYYVRCVRDIEK